MSAPAAKKPVVMVLPLVWSPKSLVNEPVPSQPEKPQVLPVFASQVLYFIESNTRSATIIGIVGAGGIGLHLSEMIRVLEWRQAAFIILLVLAAVAVIDAISRRIRRAMIGAR